MCILVQKALHRSLLNIIFDPLSPPSKKWSLQMFLLKQGALVGRTTTGWGFSQYTGQGTRVPFVTSSHDFQRCVKANVLRGKKNEPAWKANDQTFLNQTIYLFQTRCSGKQHCWVEPLALLPNYNRCFSNITSEPSSFSYSTSLYSFLVYRYSHIFFLLFFLHWDLSVDKNSLSVSPADKILAEHIQTIDGQRLAGQHVSGLQAALAGVSTEPGTDERLVPSSGGHGAVWHHAVVSAPWKANNCITFYQILSHIMSCDWGHHHSGPTWT